MIAAHSASLSRDELRGSEIELDAAQRRIVESSTGAQLVLGPAGSGKSTVLIEAIAARLLSGWRAEHMLGIAASQSAARRWRTAVVARTGFQAPQITTLHSLALQMVSADAAQRRMQPPRLLSADDQLAIISDVLAATRPRDWPALFVDALRTRAFAESVRDFIGRAALAGWSPDRLAQAEPAPAVWEPLAGVWRRYRKVVALAGAMDYTDLLLRATRLGAAASASALGWRLICVDEYGALDAVRLGLLRSVAPPEGRLIAVTDPDQVIDAFRGAAERSHADFAELFPHAVPPVVLTGCHRFGPELDALRHRLVAALPMAGVPGSVVRSHRALRRAPGRTTVDLITYPDGVSETAGIAGILRRFATASLADGAPPRWSDAAVLVRTAGQAIAVEQALLAAEIPVQRVATGRWLADEPVVALLVAGLQVAAHGAGLPVGQPPGQRVIDMLVSPMAGADPVELRRLLIALRRSEVSRAVAEGRTPRGSHELLTAALTDSAVLAAVDADRYPAVRQALALRRRIGEAARLIASGSGAAEPLWALWSDDPAGPGTWAQMLQNTALGSGPGSATAHRDLDAAIALLAEAQRSPARGGGRQVLDFLADVPRLPWPGDRMGSGRPEPAGVCLLTAHRSTGRQWPLVVVAGVQEGVWPSDAGGTGLLGEDLLTGGAASPEAARSAHAADERRLFHVACTRAAHHLVVTAVAEQRDPTGAQPSRLLADLGVDPRSGGTVRGNRLTTTGLVAELRRAAADPDSSPQIRSAAVARLSQLSGDPDFSWAEPSRWWGVACPTRAPDPLCPPDLPVTLTVTGLTELAACPWRWYVTRMLGAGKPAGTAAGIGRLVHRVNEAWANAELSRDIDAGLEVVDRVWGSLPFEAAWHSRRRRQEVAESLLRLLAWQEANADRIVFAERSFEVLVDVPDGDAVRLRGKADVAVRSGGAALAVLDLKTAKSPPSRAEVVRHVQLAGYQLAAQAGALDDDGDPNAGQPPAGAGLLMASVADGASGRAPKVLWQPPLLLDDPETSGWFTDTLAAAVDRLRSERFPAIESAACRACPVSQLCPAKNPGVIR